MSGLPGEFVVFKLPAPNKYALHYNGENQIRLEILTILENGQLNINDVVYDNISDWKRKNAYLSDI